MNNIHTTKTTVKCQRCGNIYPIRKIDCFDIGDWPEGREALQDGAFFHPRCPQCGTVSEISYPSRYIDRELGVAAVLVPGIEGQDMDALLESMNGNLEGLKLSGMEHRAVGNFYAMAELLRIHRHGLNDRAVQLLKPFMIGFLQSQGHEVWNGFFTGILHPETAERRESIVYFAPSDNEAAAYGEDVYQFDIYLTDGQIAHQGINATAYQMVMDMLRGKGLAEDDGRFHLYDLSWAIAFHNSMRQEGGEE